ncbi:alcohol dehydrogenase catalytic domain-containing protein [Streptomyces sp. FH025]|uniref:alcohol dehydrogenase catalytic domain-containing protein n=1 Tax=Streptomyces sp. FH025 TaxID=2815937 RepID=UPI001A9F5EB4|nr:alcohol dehydrogenase catalytic domain-containing protein [Streptomyces sp. FH025]MBO1419184.1 alcohol dehydrogenase catalytic domain-containing protein [Streptomyces sp. FH025]
MEHLAIERHGGSSRVTARTTPVPGPGEVVLAPESVSLCGTDIQMLRGLRDDPSPVIGHEGACRVIAVGAGVTEVAVGDRVAVNPTHPGDPSFLLGHNVDGLFQQRVLIAASAVAAGLLVPLDEKLDSASATLVEPTAVVTYATDCLARSSYEELVVIGDGLIGNLAALRASLDPGARVTLVHGGQAGLAWSARNLPGGTVRHVLARDVVRVAAESAGRPVAVLIGTHRDRTVAALDLARQAYGDAVRAVHLIGGVDAHATSRHFPGVDLPGVRAANTGGPVPPHEVRWSDGRTPPVRFTGNRGVTGRALAAAAAELTASNGRFDVLITHRRSLREGAELMNRMIYGRSRVVDGELVMRLVVDLNDDLLVRTADADAVSAGTDRADASGVGRTPGATGSGDAHDIRGVR